MSAFLYTGIFLCLCVGTFSRNKYSHSTTSVESVCVFAFITGVIATGVFFVSSGFSISLNARTVVYALAFSLVVICSYAFSLPVFHFLPVSEIGLYSSGFSLLFTSLGGFILFGEKLRLVTVIQILLMLATVILVCLSTRKKGDNSEEKKTFSAREKIIGILLCVGIGIVELGNIAVSKAFAVDTSVTNESSMFFLTNVFIVGLSAVIFIVMKKGNLGECGKKLGEIKPVYYLSIIACTVSNNIISLLSVLILKSGALSLYAPLSSALTLLSYELVGFIFKKEKIKIIPCSLAVLAIMLGIL